MTGGPPAAMLAGDVGGTRLRLAVFDAAGVMLDRRAVPTPADDPEALGRLARDVIESASLELSAFVLGVAGPIDYGDARPRRLPNLPLWEGALSAQGLADATGLPALIANDADLAALGEHRFGAGQGTSDMLYVTVSTGVGGGVVLNGRLLHGRRSLAEVGWMTIDPESGRTLEELASGTALAATTGLDGAEVTRRARAGDEAALAAFERIGGLLGIGIMNAVFCFMPERVVVGGGVSAAGDLLLDPVRRRVEQDGPRLAIFPEVVVASGGDDVGLLGAYALWRDLEDGRDTLEYAQPGSGVAERRD